MKKATLTIFAAVALIFAGCSKTGPQGPAGAPGAQGAAGNANVVGNNKNTTLPASSWKLSGSVYSDSVVDAQITSDIVNNGVVEVYVQQVVGGKTTWTNLPVISGITAMTCNFYVGGFTLFVTNSDGSVPIPPATLIFRHVIISASLKHGTTGNQKQNNVAVSAAQNMLPVSGSASN